MTKKKGAPIPNPIDGYDERCFVVKLPDAPEYRQAFLGQIFALQNWYFWEHWKEGGSRGDTRAKDAANYLRPFVMEIADNVTSEVGYCMKVIKDVSQDGCEVTFTYTDDTTETININDCPPIPLSFRVNSEGGWDYSYEGYSWESMAPLPGFPDPADGRAYGPDFPAQSALDPACNSAFAITDLLIDQQVDTYNGLVAGNDAEELAISALASAASILTGIGAAFSFIFGGTIGAIVDYVNDNDEATWNALFTSAFWDDVRCMLYCNAGPDGNFGIDEYNMLMLDLETEAGQEWQDVKGWIETLGPRGLSGAWTLRPDIVYDCSACPCRVEGVVNFDGAAGDLPFVATVGGTVQAGVGVGGTSAIRRVAYQFSSVRPIVDIGKIVDVIKVEYYTYANGPEGGRRNVQLQASTDDITYSYVYAENGVNPGPIWKKYEFSPSPSFSARYLKFICSEGGNLANYDMRIDAIKIIWRE
jgi:hypothetical protein